MTKRTARSDKSSGLSTKKSLRAIVLCSAVAGVGGMPVAHADTLSQLQSEINDLSAQLNQVKAAQGQMKKAEELHPTQQAQSDDMAGQFVSKGAIPGSFKLPGSNTSMHIGGFINFQGIYDPKVNLGPKFGIGNLMPEGTASQQSRRTFHFQDKVSRLIVGTSTPSPYGDVTTNFALDFYGFTSGGDNNQALGNNSWGARIVNAYGTIGGFLVGMTTSNFIDDPDALDSFDNAGAAGLPSGRQPQIRYTMPLNAGGALSFAIENPQSAYEDTQGNIAVVTKTNPLPDLTAKYERSGDWGHYQLSAVARELGLTDRNGVRTTKLTAAAIVGATFNLPKAGGGYGRDNGGFQTWYGAMGRYIPDDFGANIVSAIAVADGTSANPTGATSVQLQPDAGGTVFAQHWWTPELRSNIGLGINHQRLASFLPADAQNAVTTKTVHVNLIMRPIPSVDLGVEVMWGQKTYQDGTGIKPQSADRIEVGGKWHF